MMIKKKRETRAGDEEGRGGAVLNEGVADL